jgi:hypothetical protein
VVEDLRSAEAKTATAFKQTYKAPFSPFKQPVPLAKYERNLGDEEFSVAPLELLAEKLVERYGDTLAAKRLVVHEFSYRLEEIVNKPQSMSYNVIPGGGISSSTALALSLLGSAAGTAMLQGKGIDLRLHVRLDAELDGTRIQAVEQPMSMGVEGAPARVTRFAIEKFLYQLEQAPAQPQAPPEPAKAD